MSQSTFLRYLPPRHCPGAPAKAGSVDTSAFEVQRPCLTYTTLLLLLPPPSSLTTCLSVGLFSTATRTTSIKLLLNMALITDKDTMRAPVYHWDKLPTELKLHVFSYLGLVGQVLLFHPRSFSRAALTKLCYTGFEESEGPIFRKRVGELYKPVPHKP